MLEGENARLVAMERDVQWIKKRLEAGDALLAKLEKIMDGNGKLGLVAKVGILWHLQLWMIGLVGTAVGSTVTAVIFKIAGC